MWSSGQVLIHFHGPPSPGLVALFAAGALVGYALLHLATRPSDAASDLNLAASPNWLRGGAIQALAVGATLAAVAAAGSLFSPAVSWVLGGIATVLGYLGVTGLEYALQAHAAEDGA